MPDRSGPSAESVVRTRVAPGWAVWSLIVLATVIAMGATVNTWLDRQVLDTEQWVEISDQMLVDDDIRGALSTYLVSELFRVVDVQAELESLLPGRSSGLAGPITTMLRDNARGAVDQLLSTPAFRDRWSEINGRAHAAFLRVVRDDTRDSISTADGALVVDARLMLIAVAERLGLSGRAIERVPEDAARIVVFESQELDVVQRAVQVIDVMSTYLFVLIVAIYAVAVYISRDLRLALRNVGWALVVGSVVLLVARRMSVRVATEQLAQVEGGRAATAAIVSIATSLLNELAWAALSLGVIIVLYAVLTGPCAAVVAVRRRAAPLMAKPVGVVLLASGFLVAYLVLMPGFSVRHWLTGLIFAVLFLTAVESLRRQIRSEANQDLTTNVGADAEPSNTDTRIPSGRVPQ